MLAHVATDITRYREAEDRVWMALGIQPTERTVTLPAGNRVRVLEHGEGEPVLFVHGASVAGASWADLARVLGDFRCLLLDRPGCGLSDPLPDPPRDIDEVEAYADGLIADVLDALGLDAAPVVATSYGGYFALRGAAAHPDRIPKLVELSWPFGAPMEKVAFVMRMQTVPGAAALAARLPVTRGMVKSMLRQIGLERAIRTGAFDDSRLDWTVALLRHTDTQRNDTTASPKLVRPVRGLDGRVLLSDELLSRVTMPSLFLWGDEDPNGGEAIARAFTARLPDATLDLVREAGHAPWFDQLDHCAARIRSFLSA